MMLKDLLSCQFFPGLFMIFLISSSTSMTAAANTTLPTVTNFTGAGPAVTFPSVTDLPPTTKLKCDMLNELYGRLGESCAGGGIIYEFHQEDLANSVTILNTNQFLFNILPVYLVALNVGNTYNGTLETFEFTVTVSLRIDGANKTSTNFQTVSTELNHFQLQSAISINNKTPQIEILEIAFTQIKDGKVVKQSFDKRYINYIELVFIEPIEFCNHTQYEECNQTLLQTNNYSADCDYDSKGIYKYYEYKQMCDALSTSMTAAANTTLPTVTNFTGTGPAVTFPSVTDLPPTTKLKCDMLNELYGRLGESCTGGGIIHEFHQEDLANSLTILNTNQFSFNILPVYLVALNVGNTYNGTFETFEFNVTVSLRIDDSNKTSTNFQTVSTKLNHFQLQPAISINNKTPQIEILEIAFTQIKDGKVVKQSLDKRYINYIELVFIEPIEFCNHTQYEECNQILLQFLDYLADCGYDSKKIYKYYEYKHTMCDVPKFDSSPFLEGRKKIGNNATIFGCRIDMKMDYGEIRNGSFYWLINGFTKITTNVEKSQNTYQFSPLRFQPFKLSDQGYYQCYVFIPGMMTEPIKSERIDIQFSDVSSTEVTMKLNKQWSKDLENKATTGYQDIQKELQNSLAAALTKYNESGNMFIEVVGFSNYDITSQHVNAVTRIMFSNVTNEMRLKYCESFQNLKIDSNNLQISNLVETSFDCCFRNKFGDNLYKGVYEYNVTLVSDTAVQQQCKYKNNEKTMLSYRFCQPNLLNGPKWSDVNLTQCKALSQTTEDLENLDKENVCKSSLEQNCLPVTQLSSKLNNIVQNNGTITVPEDIFHIENIVTEITDGLVSLNSLEVDQVMDNVMGTVDVIMTTNSSILANAQLEKQSSTNILKQLDKGAETIGRNRSVKVSFKNIALLTAPANEASNVTVYAFEQNGNVSIKLTNNISSITEPVMAQITIPEEAFQGKKNSMYMYGFRQSSFFQGNETLLSNAQQTVKVTKFVQTYVLSATILDLIIENLTNPVVLKFSKEYFKNVEGKDICGFWDFNLGKNGGWSSNGCKSNGVIDAQYVTCECDHLTNFAILLDTAQTQYNPIELQVITWIGCGISLAGLLLTVLTYLLKRNLRKKLPPKLLISLCLSLMALLIIFLVAVEQTSPRLGCQVVAGLLQYFMLTTFFWMAVEGLNLYRLFVKLFRASVYGNFFIKASMFAWGLPAIIVGITAGLKPENLGNDKFCVVIGYSFYFGVLLPVAAILLGNFVVLILVLISLSRKSQATHQSSKKRNYLSQARVAFACSLLLGLSWAFALFAVDDTSMKIFQWLFCIFNSVQGLFIFFFYAVRNKDVRKEWGKSFGRLSLKDSSRVSSADKYELRSKSGSYSFSLKTGSTSG